MACGSVSPTVQQQNQANSPTASDSPSANNGNDSNSTTASGGSATCAPGNPNLPTPQQQAAWFTANANTIYRLLGAGVTVVASPSSQVVQSMAGQTVWAALVQDSTGEKIVRKGVLDATHGLQIPFPPVLPLPNNPNAPNDTFTLYACVSNNDLGWCAASWVQPIGEDYQNTLNSNAVHFAFDRSGGSDPSANISGFVATVDLDHADPTSSAQLPLISKYVTGEPPAGYFNLSEMLLPNGPALGNPGSSAQFIIESIYQIVDTATGQPVFSLRTNPPSTTGGGNINDVSFTTTEQVLQVGHSYTLQMYTFRSNEACVLGQSTCTPDCSVPLNDVEGDQLYILPVGGCENLF